MILKKIMAVILMSENLKIKVALIHNIVSPYRIPIFEGISNHPLIDLTVFFCAKSHKIREWEIIHSEKYKYKFLSGITIEFRDIVYHINYNIIPIILRKQFDVVIIGGSSDFTTQIAFILSKLVGTPIILWSEGIDNSKGRIGKMVSPIFNYIIKHSNAIIIPGTVSKDYHMRVGAPQNNIFIAPNIVDNDYFITQSAFFKQTKVQIKKEMKVEEKKIIIFVGQLIKRKGIDNLIQAVNKLNKTGDIILLIVGNGPLRSELEDICKVLKNQNVFFTGWIDENEKVKYYSIADIFVLPTLFDVWGLVVNEAMCCGLPVITTTTAGCAFDMVFDGENGFVVKPDDNNELAKAIKKILENPIERDRMGERSLDIIINKFNKELCVNGFIAAIKYSKNMSKT
jgi:glycosyltransferase involved in cell wall biosynthesis